MRPTALSLASLVALCLLAPAARAGEFKIDGKTFTVPDGFTIERVAGPDLVPRPIVASFDERGRLYVADSSGSSENVQKQLAEKPHRIVRLEDADGDGRFDKTSVFADRMMFPEGAMWLNGSLYVSAPPSIWKLTDTDDDGVADKREEWFQGKTLTGCANDLHGPYAGPDGWIYWAKGAFAEQRYTLPTGKPFVTKASHIFRARPDGTGIEPVMTGGMDNPVDVVFTPGGERIFSCTFLQNPAGGKRDGLIHAIYGGVYGKVHDVIESHPRTSPDVMPVLSHLGPAAACGLTRYESDAFGPDYRDNLFCTLFNMHKVTRHVLTPAGATFNSKDSDFVVCDSLDFHPTDVIEDADGSLLVVDTGGWYKLCCPTSQLNKPDVLGAIYRVRRGNATKLEDPRGLKVDWKAPPEKLILLLDDPRPAVRWRAVQELATRGTAALSALRAAMNDLQPTGRTMAVWAATRMDHPDARSVVRSALEDSRVEVACAALHSVSVRRDREAATNLLWMFKRDDDAFRRALAEAMGRVGDARHVPVLLREAGRTKDPILFHSCTYAAIEVGNADAAAAALKDPNPGVVRAAMIALDQMGGGRLDVAPVRTALDAQDAALRDTAAWIAGRHAEWGEALAESFRLRLTDRGLTPQSGEALRTQLSGLSRSKAVQQVLAQCVSEPRTPEAGRKVALSAMAAAPLKSLPTEWIEALVKALGSDDASAVADAVTVIRRIPPPNDAPAAVGAALVHVAGQEKLPVNVRVEALAAIPKESLALTPELFNFLATQVTPQQPVSVRVAASEVLGRAKLTTEQLASLADAVKTAGPLEIGRLLGAFEQSSDDEAGMKLVAALASSKAAKSLRADMVQPKLAKFSAKVREAAGPLLASLNPDAGAQRQRLEQMLKTLPKGDVRRGQLVFNGRQAACSTCHAIGYIGGHVGPDLTRVGATRSERDLLESIVFPSSSFVQTYEPVLVDTRSGDRQSGILRKNDADEVVLLTGPDQETHIPRPDVVEMRPSPVSVMPAGLDQQLSPQDLADLVAFLKACQ